MAQSEEVRSYLRAKYVRGRNEPSAAEAYAIFDPWINPDEGYIPYCAECLKNYEEYKGRMGAECEMDHSAACLWHDWFVGRIKRLNSSVVIVQKKDSRRNTQ